MILGELLFEWKKANKVSSRELARRLGMDHVTLHRFTKGENVRLEEISPVIRWVFNKTKEDK